MKNDVIGQSEQFIETLEHISRAAKINRSVLIIGERGTGKELAASRLHYLSDRWQKPFITLNCASLNPSLLESELFGHEAGSFTGAKTMRKGRFEMAHKGTLFLDEIGNMPLIVQEKILRAIEYRTFERVGGSEAITVDTRIIAATNADLPRMVQEHTFKDDLLDRLSFDVVNLPPLRERKDDILLLARHFATAMAAEIGITGVIEFSNTVSDQLEQYQWPGNIRELKNVVERAVYRANSEFIDEIIFNPFKSSITPSFKNDKEEKQTPQILDKYKNLSFTDTINQFTTDYLLEAFKAQNFHQKKTAQALGLTYNQFRGLYRKHGLKKVVYKD